MIEKLNQAIENALNGLKTNIRGIAEPILVIDQDGEMEMPAIVMADGECFPIIDDSSDLCSYHKINRKSYTRETNKGYGDKVAITSYDDMSLIVYGVRGKIAALEAEKKITRAISNIVNVESVEFNRTVIFGTEYSGVQFFLQPNIFLFRINYKIKQALPTCNY